MTDQLLYSAEGPVPVGGRAFGPFPDLAGSTSCEAIVRSPEHYEAKLVGLRGSGQHVPDPAQANLTLRGVVESSWKSRPVRSATLW